MSSRPDYLPIPPPDSLRPMPVGSRYMVVTGHPLITQIAAQVLERGGNAIDAGVSAAIASTVIQADMANVGGIAPMAIRRAGSDTVETISGVGVWGREVSLAEMERRFGGNLAEGAASWIVPAAPDAWITALEQYGTRPLAEMAAPAIAAAVDGFTLDTRAAAVLNVMGTRRFAKWDTTRSIYWPEGRPPRTGDVLRQPELGAVLQALAEGGRDAFYEGDIARRMVEYCRSLGGWLALEDLAGYHSRVEPAVARKCGPWTIHITGAWSQGPALLQALAVVEGLDLARAGHNTAAYIHMLVEALKLVFADRELYYGDPAFVDVDLEWLLSDDHAGDLRSRIGPRAWLPDVPLTRATAGDKHLDTTYISVIDHEGNAFSCSPSDTLEAAPLVPGLGIMVSPRGSQSRLDPSHPSVLGPGRRPRITPCPAIAMRDSGEVSALGAPGGDQIVQAVLQAWLNMEVGMNPQQAAEAPRFASFSNSSSFFPWTGMPGLLGLEGRFDPSIIDELADRGHNVVRLPDFEFENAAFCMSADLLPPAGGHRVLAGAADPRRSCYALGR
jgi:gamma-glutamyltranspeptidase/glutathione hydrolase